MPGFQRVYEEKREAGFVVLGLSMDAGGAWVVRRYVEETGITYPVAMATRESVRAFGGIPTLPTSILIDREGRVRHEVRGIFAARTLEAAVERLLAEGVEAAALREER
jgi:peroxiredoxin